MKPRGPRRLFLDTGVLLAVVLPRDPDNGAAIRLLERLADAEWSAAYTTDYVMAEGLNFIRKKIKRQDVAEAFLGLIFGAKDAAPVVASLLKVHGGRFARALDRYRADFGLGLSLTDWTTVAAMEDASIQDIATFDEGFRAVASVVEGL